MDHPTSSADNLAATGSAPLAVGRTTIFGPNTIETYTGGGFDLSNPKAVDVRITDIAAGLSNTCRFGGHCRCFYSVAEHSVLVADLVAHRLGGRAPYPELVLAALLHDAHEAYLGDVPKPIKGLLGDAFRELGAEVDTAVGAAFAIAPSLFKHPWIKQADTWALHYEARNLMPSCGAGWSQEALEAWGVSAADEDMHLPTGVQWRGGLEPAVAMTIFLDRAAQLGHCERELPEAA